MYCLFFFFCHCFVANVLTRHTDKMSDRLCLISQWQRLVEKGTVPYYGTFKMGNISEDRYLNPLKSDPSDVLFPGMKSVFVQSRKDNAILTMGIFSKVLTSECSLCRSNKLIYNSLTYILLCSTFSAPGVK